MMTEEIPSSILVVLRDDPTRMGGAVMQKLLSMLEEKVIRGTNGVIGVGGIVLMNDRQHLR